MLSINECATDVRLSDLLSQTAVAQKLGMNVWQVQRLLTTGKLQHVQLPDRRRYVLKASLEAYQRGRK